MFAEKEAFTLGAVGRSGMTGACVLTARVTR